MAPLVFGCLIPHTLCLRLGSSACERAAHACAKGFPARHSGKLADGRSRDRGPQGPCLQINAFGATSQDAAPECKFCSRIELSLGLF